MRKCKGDRRGFVAACTIPFVRINFFGTGAGSTTPGRAGSAMLVRSQGHSLLLDCGPRAVDRLVDAGLADDTIETILVTHLHPDHVLGLPAFLQSTIFPAFRPPAIFGPAGTAEFVTRTSGMLSLASGPPGQPWGSPLGIGAIEVAGGQEWETDGFAIRSEVVHHVPYLVAMAHRLESEGRRIVFSGDTTPLPEIMVPLADGADILIHECWSTAGMERWVGGADPRRANAIRNAFRQTHSELSAVAQIAADAGVKRLVLTHLNQGELAGELIAEASRTFPGQVIVADDRLVIDV